MATEPELPVEERLFQLLQHLGIQQAHFAARLSLDWGGLASRHPEKISSLTLVCPTGVDSAALHPLASRLLVFAGDQGPHAERVGQVVASFPDATLITLSDYFSPGWADVIADRTDDTGSAMLEFLARMDQLQGHEAAPLREGEGEVAGITYRIRGSGPPLVLLPLSLAPSQWEPLLPRLSERYCTITLGGVELGFVALLESRGLSTGLRTVVRNLMDEVQLRSGESVLDVGCGSGVFDRWLARSTGGANRIVAVDVNRYLLREATALAEKEGFGGVIEFSEGSAEALPFPDRTFDVTLSCTVMEEVDADRMLAEMVRVTKPGGRVAVIVRSVDMPWWANLPLRAELKTKVEAVRGPVEERGCADAALYRRFHEAGLTQVKMFPQLAAFGGNFWVQFYSHQILPALSPQEADEWRAAVARAEAEGTLFFAMPHHCAVGTKP